MKKSKALAAILAAAMAASTFGCFTVSADVPAFEDMVFPDEMPTNPTQAEDGYYDYDDMSVHYDLTFSTYSYGVSVPEDDPIKSWLEEKYNVSITFETPQSADVETDISTAFSSGSTADVYCLSSGYKNLCFTLAEQDLLTDGKEMLPYMPQTSKFVTNSLIKYSTMEDGQMPFVTKYAIQDGDIWNLAIRQDWLDALGMEIPTTLDELLAYAIAVTKNDPDGNGVDDTYFMVGAGSGSSLNMLEGLMTYFGNPSYYVDENGEVSMNYLDGSRKEYLEFVKALYDNGCMPADWYTISWENAKSYTLYDKIGMVNYPISNWAEEYTETHAETPEDLNNWVFLSESPTGEGKAKAGGNAGSLFVVPSANIDGDEGKLMRICHILDAMVYGGEAYFQTVQNGSAEVWEAAGYEGTQDIVTEYKENGRSTCYIPKTSTENPHPIYAIDSTGLALASWQNFGYTLKWQDAYAATESEQIKVDFTNVNTDNISQLERWENTAILYTLPSDVTATLDEFVAAQEYAFVVGSRSLDEWDDYVNEWYAQGGKDCLEAAANGLGCEMTTYFE